jgi:hypothetical protein
VSYGAYPNRRRHLLAGGFGRSADTGLGHIEEAVGAKLQPPGSDQAPRENGRIRGETVDLVHLNARRCPRVGSYQRDRAPAGHVGGGAGHGLAQRGGQQQSH